MSTTSTKMRRALFKRENTITLSLVESQKNISELLAKLDETHSGNGDKDFAYVQANISELLGKFEDSHTDMQGDLNDILESFQKGTMSHSEISELIRNEKERGAMSMQLVQGMQTRLDEVLSFVAHFVTDVESGTPLPKDSFKALFQELDTVADSVHAMGKVVRTPTRRVAEVKKKLSLKLNPSEDGNRGISSNLASFFQQQDQIRRNMVRDIKARPDEARDPKVAKKSDRRSSERDLIDKRTGSPPLTTARSNRPANSLRALSRQSSLESTADDGLSGDEELELTGKKSNFTVKKIQRQASGQQTIRSALVRSLTQEMSDDEISYDSNESMVNRRAKVSKNHRQTQTDEEITKLRGDSVAAQPGVTIAKTSTTRESRVAGLPEALRRQSQPPTSAVLERNSPMDSSSPAGDISEHAHHKSSLGVLRNHGQPISSPSPKASTDISHEESSAPIADKTSTEPDSSATASSNTTGNAVSKPNTSAAKSDQAESKKGVKGTGHSKSSTRKKSDPKVSATDSGARMGSVATTLTATTSSSSKPSGRIEVKSLTKEEIVLLEITFEEASAEENAAKGRTDQEGRDLFLDLKEKRLDKIEKALQFKQENFELLCDSRIRQQVEIELKRALSAPPGPNGTVSAAGRDKVEAQTAQSGTTGSEKGENKSLNHPSPLAADTQNTPGGAVIASTGPLPDGTKSANSAETAAASKGVGVSTPLSQSTENFQKILKTILLYLPRQAEWSPSVSNLLSTAPGSRGAESGVGKDGTSGMPSSARHGEEAGVRGAGREDRITAERQSDESPLLFPPISTRPNTSDATAIGRSTSRPGTGRSRPNSARGGTLPRSRQSGRAVTRDELITDDEDALSVNFDSYSATGARMSQQGADDRLRQYDLKSGLGEIWVPPPTGLARKKMPGTIVIFPLHTLDQGTSTDDLVVDPPLPSLAEQSMSTSSVAEEIVAPTVSMAPGEHAPATDRVPVPDTALETIQKELTQSSNPLSTLYHHFFPYLSVLSRHHLMAAASGVSCNRSGEVDVGIVTSKAAPTYSTKGLASLFEIVAEEVSKLEYTSYHALEALYSCEEVMNNLIVVANSEKGVDASFYETLGEASRQLGEIEIAEAWTDMLLTNSRTIFARVRALSIDPKTIGKSYDAAYSALLSCQGTNVTLKQRVAILKKRIGAYLRRPMYVLKQETSGNNKDLQLKCQRLSSRIEELEDSLADNRDELDELREQLIQIDQRRDTTPAAMWFFSALHNPRLPDIVATHLQHMNSVKGVIEGKEHFDFLVLKRRLEACFLGVPAIQGFFKKYVSLHKKYTQTRTRLFLDRKLIGGDADGYFVCPMCNTDCRHNPDAGFPAHIMDREQPKVTDKKSARRLMNSMSVGLMGSPALPSTDGGLRSSFGR